MQKQEGTVQLDKNNRIINEGRGFTERSLKILLKKICDMETKEEAAARGLSECNPADDFTGHSATYEKEAFPPKKALPLIKTMHMRDPSRSQFSVQRYNRHELEQDEELAREAYGDIRYDEFLRLKPEYVDEQPPQTEEGNDEHQDASADDLSQAPETRRSADIFKVKKMTRNDSFEAGDGNDSESSGFAHYFKCAQKAHKGDTQITPQPCELARPDENLNSCQKLNEVGSNTSPSETERDPSGSQVALQPASSQA